MIKGVRVKELKIADKNNTREIFEITNSQGVKRHKHIGFIKFKPKGKFSFHYHQNLDEVYVPIEGELVIFLHDTRESSKTYGKFMEIDVNKPMKILIPPGVEHAYLNPTNKNTIMVLLSNHHWHKRHNIVDKKMKKEFLERIKKYQ